MRLDRRKGREVAVQGLYEMEVRGVRPDGLELFWQTAAADLASTIPRTSRPEKVATLQNEIRKVIAFGRSLLEGAAQAQPEIDALIAAATSNWRTDRLSLVDRCVLRLATFEMLHRSDIPTTVTLNEAIEIARRFSTGESARFVNGVLDQIASRVGAKDQIKHEASDDE